MVLGSYLCLQELKFVMYGVSYISSTCTSVCRNFKFAMIKFTNIIKTYLPVSRQCRLLGLNVPLPGQCDKTSVHSQLTAFVSQCKHLNHSATVELLHLFTSTLLKALPLMQCHNLQCVNIE